MKDALPNWWAAHKNAIVHFHIVLVVSSNLQLWRIENCVKQKHHEHFYDYMNIDVVLSFDVALNLCFFYKVF